jgi:2-polyprenyl-3-methyl-5-hydroxy-6-metoxy-1,4-benzoquinol methylase
MVIVVLSLVSYLSLLGVNVSGETFESQYNYYFEIEKKFGKTHLGLSSNSIWNSDSSRLSFVLSRYKFVSRMFSGFQQVLEIGCGDGFASKIVADRVQNLTISDVDPIFVKEAKKVNINQQNMAFENVNYVEDYLKTKFDGIYAIDVLEHIKPQDESKFLLNILKSLLSNGVLILGIPSLESQKYASPLSKEGHVNCKSGNDFKTFLSMYFHNVFIFSMNDEVLHTGFHGMSHYLFAIAAHPKHIEL